MSDVTETVSVALCTYNGARFLAEQLASLVAQTLPPTELVVTDDASSDDTPALLEHFAAHAPFPVRIYHQPSNRGSTASFEATIAACRGPLIALCDQDDVWHPNKLERLCAALARDPDAGYVFSDAELVDQTLRPLGRRMWQTVAFGTSEWQQFRGTRQIEMLLERTRVTGATMMLRSTGVPLCLPFPTGVIHDRWLALVLSAVGRYGIALNEVLIDYRQHAGQQIGAIQRRGRPGLRDQLGRDFVLARRRRMRQELALDDQFVAQLDRLLAETDVLNDREAAQARHSRALVRERIRHVAARTAQDDDSLTRIGATIAAELGSGRYHRYSGGTRAMLADLLYCFCYRKRS